MRADQGDDAVSAAPRLEIVPGAGGLPIAVDRWVGGERVSVVLLHGGGQTRHAWGATGAMLFARGHDVCSVDLRGHGDSGWSSDKRYSLDDFRDDLDLLLERLQRPAVLVGASLGGITSLLSIGERGAPNVRGLVLVDITPRPSQGGVSKIRAFMTAHPDGFPDLDAAAAAVAAYMPHRRRPANPTGLMKNLRLRDGRLHWHWDPDFLQMVSTGQTPDPHRLERAARRVTVPTLLVRGQLSDIVSPEDAKALVDLIPHAKVVEVEDAAHMVAGDHNTIFGDAVVAFLDELEKPAGKARSPLNY